MSESSDRKRVSGGPNKRKGEKGPNSGANLGVDFTDARKKQFCEALLVNHGNRLAACRAIGVHRMTVTRHLKEDPDFLELFEETMEVYREQLVAEVHRRAVEGTLKPVFFQGRRAFDRDADGQEIDASIREYDTALLIMLVKRHCPEFREKQVVENRNVNMDMGLKDIEELSEEERQKLRELLELKGKDGVEQ
jgi:hypothetical protein